MTRVVWTSDLLPDELAGRTAAMMERGVEAMKEAFGHHFDGAAGR